MSQETNVKLELAFTDADGFVFKVEGNGADLATVLVMACSANEAFDSIAKDAVDAFQANKAECIKEFQEFMSQPDSE